MKKRDFFKVVSALLVAPTIGLSHFAKAAPETKPSSIKTAVVYFTKTGNTESVAKAVQAAIGADLYRVETVEPYPDGYRETTNIVRKEIENGTIRPIKELKINLAQYDAIVLASPTWWHHIASPLEAWIKTVDLSGKLILTCNTHGGGGIMHTREDYERLLPKSSLGSHFTVYGSVSLQSRAVRTWLRENKLID